MNHEGDVAQIDNKMPQLSTKTIETRSDSKTDLANTSKTSKLVKDYIHLIQWLNIETKKSTMCLCTYQSHEAVTTSKHTSFVKLSTPLALEH